MNTIEYFINEIKSSDLNALLEVFSFRPQWSGYFNFFNEVRNLILKKLVIKLIGKRHVT